MVMDASELMQRYADGERDFAQVDLSQANLSEAILNQINLSGANLLF